MNQKCPNCYEGVLLGWHELSDDEREVVKRLPGSADYANEERESLHRWCTRCWYEDRHGEVEA
jgi:ribosomal protein S27AE